MMTGSFRVDLSRVRSKIGEGVKAKAERITQTLVDSFIRDSPVRSGAFRGSWNVSEGAPIYVTIGRVRTPGVIGAPTITVRARTNFPIFFITNGQPYAKELEYGSSQQAPLGVVRINIANLR